MDKVYIAGAHSRGATLGYYLTYLDPSVEILAYLYDNNEENPSYVNDVPVIRIEKNTILNAEYPVYLATKGVNHAHLIETLNVCGMNKIIPVDVALDMDLRNKFLRRFYESNGREFCKINDIHALNGEMSDNEASLLVVTSAFDKALKNMYELNKYERTIQVGVELTDVKIEVDYYDNVGDNISDRNRQFCELTALYWIWRHVEEKIVGLEHYRRHFILPDDWLDRMISNEVDVILPVPLYVLPSLEGNYKSRHEEKFWCYMLEYLKKHIPDDYSEATKFFNETSLYSPCNMFIMRREVLNELCSWMFPILFAVAEKGGTIDDSYQNRYPGFISERLITYFFEANREKYKIVYADKNFLE